MRSKNDILNELQEAIDSGVISNSDIRNIADDAEKSAKKTPAERGDKVSAVDVMFYIAGIVLFSTVMSMIMQSWDGDTALGRIMMTVGIGSVLWAIAFYLMRQKVQSEIRSGLTNSLLLTGSLLVIVGGYIVTNEIIGGFDEINFMPFAVALLVLGGLHIGFDRFIKKNLILMMGVLLSVAAFPSLMFGVIRDADLSIDAWMAVLVVTAGVLVYATRVVAKINPERRISGSFDGFAAFLAMMSMYAASYGDYSVVWFAALIASVLGIFYLSIVLQNKNLLGNASFFMVLTIITISFKYFSGYGVTYSLIVATLGLLGSAAVASSINKKYFK